MAVLAFRLHRELLPSTALLMPHNEDKMAHLWDHGVEIRRTIAAKECYSKTDLILGQHAFEQGIESANATLINHVVWIDKIRVFDIVLERQRVCILEAQ